MEHSQHRFPSNHSRSPGSMRRGHGTCEASARLLRDIARARLAHGSQCAVVLVACPGLQDTMQRRGGAWDDLWRRVLAALTAETGPADMCRRIDEDLFLLLLGGRSQRAADDFVRNLRRRWNAAMNACGVDIDVRVGVAHADTIGSAAAASLWLAANEACNKAFNEAFIDACDEARHVDTMGSQPVDAGHQIQRLDLAA